MKLFKRMILVVAIVVLLSSSYKIITYLYSSQGNKDIYKEVSEDYAKEGSLDTLNENIIAWISLPNTRIDYPLVRGDDNLFYLDHDINKKPSIHGTIEIKLVMIKTWSSMVII